MLTDNPSCYVCIVIKKNSIHLPGLAVTERWQLFWTAAASAVVWVSIVDVLISLLSPLLKTRSVIPTLVVPAHTCDWRLGWPTAASTWHTWYQPKSESAIRTMKERMPWRCIEACAIVLVLAGQRAPSPTLILSGTSSMTPETCRRRWELDIGCQWTIFLALCKYLGGDQNLQTTQRSFQGEKVG